MIKKLLSLLLIGVLICSMLTCCNSKNKHVSQNGINSEQSGNSDSTKLNNGTCVRKIQGGFLKEVQNSDETSKYQIVYNNEAATGLDTDLRLEFSSIQNICMLDNVNTTSDMWKYENGEINLTISILCIGSVPLVNNTEIAIDNTSYDDIKSIIDYMTVFEDTIESRKTDTYSAITFKVANVDTGLNGYITIFDDNETSLRWAIQFLTSTESLDLDMLKLTAQSVALSTDFDREVLEHEYEMNNTSSEDSSETVNNTEVIDDNTEVIDETVNNTEVTDNDINQPAEPDEGPGGVH